LNKNNANIKIKQIFIHNKINPTLSTSAEKGIINTYKHKSIYWHGQCFASWNFIYCTL